MQSLRFSSLAKDVKKLTSESPNSPETYKFIIASLESIGAYDDIASWKSALENLNSGHSQPKDISETRVQVAELSERAIDDGQEFNVKSVLIDSIVSILPKEYMTEQLEHFLRKDLKLCDIETLRAALEATKDFQRLNIDHIEGILRVSLINIAEKNNKLSASDISELRENSRFFTVEMLISTIQYLEKTKSESELTNVSVKLSLINTASEKGYISSEEAQNYRNYAEFYKIEDILDNISENLKSGLVAQSQLETMQTKRHSKTEMIPVSGVGSQKGFAARFLDFWGLKKK